jgi:hypothetical protein
VKKRRIRFTVPKNKQRTQVRCRRKIKGIECGFRQTLNKQPLEYVRPPKCKRCNKPFTYIDFYRANKERKVKPCHCMNYNFPHFKGRGYCVHNKRLTAEDMRLREEGPSNATDAPF